MGTKTSKHKIPKGAAAAAAARRRSDANKQIRKLKRSSQPHIADEDACVEALSHALQAIDEELYDSIHDALLRLIASFLPYGEFHTGYRNR